MKIAILSDFSKTLTASTNPTTWSVFAKSGLLGEEYISQRDALFQKYHDFELAGDVQKTKKWWAAHMDLFAKFGLDSKLIQQIISDKLYFKPREGLSEFFSYISDVDFDSVIVTSSGISNFVQQFLEYHLIDTQKIQIIGNTLNFNSEDQVIGHGYDIITSLNKYEHGVDMSAYDHVVLLGDDESDLQMCSGDNVLKIGFCEQKVIGYDIYLGKEATFQEVIPYIEEIKNK